MVRCPGQDQRFWKPDDVFETPCPVCGKAVEFFKDEPKLKCRKCGQQVANPKIDLGCAEWCQYAEQCVGVTAPIRTRVMRDRLVDEMKRVFAGDRKRIDHALAVLEYAEQIQDVEGADPLVVRAAAILHDIGILEAERKYGSSVGKYQEIEGPPIARQILEKHDVDAEAVDHICRIVGSHHSAADIDTVEFRCVWDADWLINMPEIFADKSKPELKGGIDSLFKTRKGRELAMALFVDDERGP
ncbi:MAG: HD domain-containing protein [Planctomycetota bacterium]|jgi:putative nucleotidyltransferase with HDIG domain